MDSKSIIIAGCAHNNEDYLHKVFKNIYAISELFSTYKIIIFENSSRDKTLEILFDYRKQDSNVVVITQKNIPIPYGAHPVRVAYCRNMILNKINSDFADYDYMMMIDLDNVCSSPINIDNFKESFNDKSWDSLSFNRKSYYDRWALRYPPFTKNCWNFPQREKAITYITHLSNNISQILKDSKELFPVYSAFNGCAIYKMSKIKNCRYSAKNREKPLVSGFYGIMDCEHVGFHRAMMEKHNARIFISPLILFT